MNCKLLLIGFVVILITKAAVAQSSVEMLAQIQKSKSDTGRIRLLLKLSRSILFKSGTQAKDVDSAYRYTKQAEQLSLRAKDVKGQGHTALMAALIRNEQGNRKAGLFILKKHLLYLKA